jgi:hypothetical protein
MYVDRGLGAELRVSFVWTEGRGAWCGEFHPLETVVGLLYCFVEGDVGAGPGLNIEDVRGAFAGCLVAVPRFGVDWELRGT